MSYWMIVGPEKQAWAHAMQRGWSDELTVVVSSAEEMRQTDPTQIEGVVWVQALQLGWDEAQRIAEELYVMHVTWPDIWIMAPAPIMAALHDGVVPKLRPVAA